MPILQEMSKDPETRTKFNFVAIPRSKAGKDWEEKEAATLFQVNTYWLDWDGGKRLSGFSEDVRGSLECEFSETFPDADAMDDAPVAVLVPSKESMHAVAMMGPNATKIVPSRVNIHPRKLQWKPEARQGYFRYDPVKRTPQPLVEMNVRAFEQAFENAQTAAGDTGLDKTGGHLFIKRYKKEFEKFRGFVGREVRWELRLAEASI